MSTLYIDRKDARLKIEGKSLVSYINEQRQRSIPLAILERIVIACHIQLSSRMFLKLSEANIALTFINPRNASQRAMLVGSEGRNPQTRLLQYQASLDENFKVRIAKLLILAKIRNHQRFFQKVLDSRAGLRHPMSKTVEELANIRTKLNTRDVSVETLRGIEGNAARVSFSAYQYLFPKSLGFDGRKRRPPPDPVNVCLSLAYTMLHYRAAQQAYAMGLDPMIGFLHEVQYSRDSLAADLIEPWRPHVDEWVYQMFQERQLRPEDFTVKPTSCLLGKAGRQRFYASFESWQKPVTRAIRIQLNQLIKALRQEYSEQPESTKNLNKIAINNEI